MQARSVTEQIADFEAQHEGMYNVICPIKLLMIHALRNGMIKDANSLDEALANSAMREDKTIQWAQLSRTLSWTLLNQLVLIKYGVRSYTWD